MIKRFVGLLRSAWVEYERDRARYLAVAMIYYAGVSLVPLLALLLSGLGVLVRFLPAAALAERDLVAAIQGHVGPEGLVAVQSLLETIHEQSLAAMLVSVGGIVFTSALLFKQLRHAFRAIWKYEPVLTSGSVGAVVRATVFEQIIAFVMLICGSVLLLGGLVLIASTRWFNQLLGNLLGDLPVISQLAGWLVTTSGALVLSILTFWPLFRFLPPVQISWRDAWPATMLSAIVWVAAVEFLAIYGALFGDSAAGALGGLFAALILVKTVSQVLFFGAELCKVQHQARGRVRDRETLLR